MHRYMNPLWRSLKNILTIQHFTREDSSIHHSSQSRLKHTAVSNFMVVYRCWYGQWRNGGRGCLMTLIVDCRHVCTGFAGYDFWISGCFIIVLVLYPYLNREAVMFLHSTFHSAVIYCSIEPEVPFTTYGIPQAIVRWLRVTCYSRWLCVCMHTVNRQRLMNSRVLYAYTCLLCESVELIMDLCIYNCLKGVPGCACVRSSQARRWKTVTLVTPVEPVWKISVIEMENPVTTNMTSI